MRGRTVSIPLHQACPRFCTLLPRDVLSWHRSLLLPFLQISDGEYTYYDGEFRFARIKAKRKRKGLGRVQMEDVLALAPKGDRSVYKYENDNSLACKDLTSGESGTKIYELVFKGEKGINRYEFEPDEEMLDAVMVKYPRAVIK